MQAPAAPVAVRPPTTDISFTKVELPPSLPMMVFASSERFNSQRVGALAIYCSDGRWGDAFDEFCHRSLLIPRYDRFAVPGGAAWITQDSGARGQLEFLVREHGLQRIVLITHYECAFYKDRVKDDAHAGLPAQFEDLKKAATQLRQWFSEVSVEGYLAMRNGDLISFHRVEV